jgi:hypothetical protein
MRGKVVRTKWKRRQGRRRSDSYHRGHGEQSPPMARDRAIRHAYFNSRFPADSLPRSLMTS